jgi:hypothetical protein
LQVKVAFNGRRSLSERDIVIEFGETAGSFSILRIMETELNTVSRYKVWARNDSFYGKEVLDAVFSFCQREYDWCENTFCREK